MRRHMQVLSFILGSRSFLPFASCRELPDQRHAAQHLHVAERERHLQSDRSRTSTKSRNATRSTPSIRAGCSAFDPSSTKWSRETIGESTTLYVHPRDGSRVRHPRLHPYRQAPGSTTSSTKRASSSTSSTRTASPKGTSPRSPSTPRSRTLLTRIIPSKSPVNLRNRNALNFTGLAVDLSSPLSGRTLPQTLEPLGEQPRRRPSPSTRIKRQGITTSPSRSSPRTRRLTRSPKRCISPPSRTSRRHHQETDERVRETTSVTLTNNGNVVATYTGTPPHELAARPLQQHRPTKSTQVSAGVRYHVWSITLAPQETATVTGVENYGSPPSSSSLSSSASPPTSPSAAPSSR